MATIRVRVSHLTSGEVAESIQRADDSGEPISDACAVTIASWYHSPGWDGKHFAALASGCAVDSGDVLANIGDARRLDVPGMPESERSDAIAQLDRLQEWLDTKDDDTPNCVECGERPWGHGYCGELCAECASTPV